MTNEQLIAGTLGPRGDYTTVEIRIFAPTGQEEVYPLELRVMGGPEFSRRVLRLNRADLDAMEIDPRAQGMMLGEMLFADEALGRVYREAISAALASDKGLRVRLRVDPPGLHEIHWERVYYPVAEEWRPMGITAVTPFSRYVPVPTWDRPEPVTGRPLRVLAIIASPANLDEYGLDPINDEERQALRETLDGLPGTKVTYLESGTANPPTLGEIDETLAQGFHVVHFLCHAASTPGGTVLYLEDEDGTLKPAPAGRILASFQALEAPPLLCFLAACESATRGRYDGFVPLGPALVGEGGLHAVIAMTGRVGMRTARHFSGQFYDRLLAHGAVDLAVNEARALVQDEWDWGVPVLFSRLPDNQLIAADPVRVVLQAICRLHEEKKYLPLPVEVVHLVEPRDRGSVEQLGREPTLSIDLANALPAALARHQPGQSQQKKVVILVGGHGMAKSTQLRQIAYITARRSLSASAGSRVVPIYVDLGGYPTVRPGPRGRLETLMLEGLKPLWPRLEAAALAGLLGCQDGDLLLVLLDGGDDLPEGQRREAWQDVQDLVDRYPWHQYMLATDPDHLDLRILDVTDLLIIQPTSQRRIEQFLLKDLGDSSGPRLYDALVRHQIFDLAGPPWLLVRMLKQAQQGIYPRSRSAVLRGMVESSLAQVSGERGVGSRAAQSLYQLAWEMQFERCSIWPVSKVFGSLAAVRGNREYSLEELYDLLVENELVTRVGLEAMRFTYPAIQAYCAARAILEIDDLERTVDDITATLGRLTRLRWWEDTLVLLSGLMSDPNVLLESIIYGAYLTEGERVFLAARCILEARQQQGHEPVDENLVNQVLSALFWRLDSAHELRPGLRARTAESLGQLRHSSAVPDLARVAGRQVRISREGRLDYEYSNVRMAAALALRRMMPQFTGNLQAANPQLAALLQLWGEGEDEAVQELARQLYGGDESLQPIAAFALGDLQTRPAIEVLIDAFLDPGMPSHTRWAVTDALLLLDPAMVMQRTILPLLDEAEARREGILGSRTWKRRADWYVHLAYLVGKTRAQHPVVDAFLERCLYQFTGVRLKEMAIHALGWMYDSRYKEQLEAIAIGDFEGISLGKSFSQEDAVLLRRVAIYALANIGDWNTVAKIRANRTDWDRELERALYDASEEISWRLSLAGNR